MDFETVITRLRQNISELPGHEAHAFLSPPHRLSTVEYLQMNPSYKASSVAIILFPDAGTTRMLLIERAGGMHAHAGQISFPGGRREHDDPTLLHTAMREMYEEVGITPSQLQIIGALSELYIPVSNYLVHPFVGYSTEMPATSPNPAEVKRIIFADLMAFIEHEEPEVAEFETAASGLIRAPYYAVDGLKIWGATAMVISELVYILKNKGCVS